MTPFPSFADTCKFRKTKKKFAALRKSTHFRTWFRHSFILKYIENADRL